MVRSCSVAPLVLALTLGGFACGQSPLPAAPGTGSAGGEKTFLLKERGQAERRCRVLISWTLADGSRAYDIQTLDNGERITVVESGTTSAADGGRFSAVGTRNFHWGDSP